MIEFVTNNEQETKGAAAEIVKQLGDDHVLLLQGNLGSGKTTFAKGIAEALGVQDVVTSPTFVLMKVYDVESRQWQRLVHVDLYRLENVTQDQLRELGLQEYLDDKDTLVLIEWPEMAEKALSGRLLRFEVIGAQRRIIDVQT